MRFYYLCLLLSVAVSKSLSIHDSPKDDFNHHSKELNEYIIHNSTQKKEIILIGDCIF